MGPVLRGGGAAVPLVLGAVGIHEGQRAPHVAGGVGLLVRRAQRQQAVVADLPVDHAVQEGALALKAAQVRAALLARGHQAAGPAAVVGEGPRVVGLDARRAPGAVAQAQRALRLVGRALAHEVERARRVAHTGQQPVGAADDFDLLVAEGIHRAGDDAPVVGQAHAVDLGVGDVEAARGVGGAVGFPLIHGDAGAHAQRVVEVADSEVAHLLGGHDADGLRRFLDVQVQPGRAAAHPVLAHGDDLHFFQRGFGRRAGLGQDQAGWSDQQQECDGAPDRAQWMAVHRRQSLDKS